MATTDTEFSNIGRSGMLTTTDSIAVDDGPTNIEIINSADFWSDGDYAGMTLAEEAAARDVSLAAVVLVVESFFIVREVLHLPSCCFCCLTSLR